MIPDPNGGMVRQSKRNRNLLVTGCTGFVASKVNQLLLRRGDKVIRVDDLSNAYDVRLKEWRLAQPEGFQNFTFYRVEIIDPTQLEPLFEKSKFDVVINFPARAGVRASVENPVLCLDTNIIGTLNLLELCRKYRIKKFIPASTSSIYRSLVGAGVGSAKSDGKHHEGLMLFFGYIDCSRGMWEYTEDCKARCTVPRSVPNAQIIDYDQILSEPLV